MSRSDQCGRLLPCRKLAGSAVAVLISLAAPALWADCTISATGVAFGSYDVLSGASADGVGTIGVDCTPSASFSVALSSGGGSYTQRQMAGAGDTLTYNLYTNPARTVIWGDGSGGTGTMGGSGDSVNLNVYGRIPGGQNLKAGNYGDTIIVTVTF